MSYIGNTPTTQNFIAGTDQFTGDGSSTSWTLSRLVNSSNDIEVVIANVVQNPTSYSVSGNTLTISPAIGNAVAFYVRYLSTTLQSVNSPQGVTTQFGSGAVSAPSITFSNDTNTGIYSPAADTIAFVEGGTESMRLDSSGNVGIGTSSPNNNGAGSTTVTVNNTNAAVYDLNISGVRTATFFSGGAGAVSGAGTVTSTPFYFLTGGSERMRIDSSGNVGIGQTPTAYGSTVRNVEAFISGASGFTLVSASTTNVKTEIAASQSSLLGQVGTRTNHPLVLKTNDTERARIDTSGNVQLSTAGTRVLNSSGNPILQQTGSVLQVQNVYLTSATQLTSSGALHELTTSLRISFTPISASSTIFLECYGSFVSPQSNNLQYAAFYNVTSAAYINLPPANGSRARVHWFNRTTSFDVNDAAFMYFCVPVANTNTTARTYTVYHGTEGSVIQFLSSTLSTASGATYPLYFQVTEVAA